TPPVFHLRRDGSVTRMCVQKFRPSEEGTTMCGWRHRCACFNLPNGALDVVENDLPRDGIDDEMMSDKEEPHTGFAEIKHSCTEQPAVMERDRAMRCLHLGRNRPIEAIRVDSPELDGFYGSHRGVRLSRVLHPAALADCEARPERVVMRPYCLT